MAAEFRPRVERAITFIMNHLDRTLTLPEVSGAARLSPFYFHRIFTSFAGEPVGRFITRTRLHRAAMRLAYEPDCDVTEVARSSGYSSPSNFSKAFTAFYGCSPSMLRRPNASQAYARGGKLERVYGLTVQPEALYRTSFSPTEEAATSVLPEPRYVDTPAIPLCCLATPTGATSVQTARTWAQLSMHMRALGLDEGMPVRVGLRFENALLTAAHLRRYHCCVPCWPGFLPPPPLFAGRVPAGRYAVFRLAGSPTELAAQYHAVYARWPADRKVVPESIWPIEYYQRAEPLGERGLEVWVKVRPRR